jgi:hypothetical protein
MAFIYQMHNITIQDTVPLNFVWEGSKYKKEMCKRTGKKTKTYNSGYSLVVTHLTTNPPIRCLNMAERTGSLVFNVLWLYVAVNAEECIYIVD